MMVGREAEKHRGHEEKMQKGRGIVTPYVTFHAYTDISFSSLLFRHYSSCGCDLGERGNLGIFSMVSRRVGCNPIIMIAPPPQISNLYIPPGHVRRLTLYIAELTIVVVSKYICHMFSSL